MDKNKMIETMRKCAEDKFDDTCATCPYATVQHDCCAQLLLDAAEMMEQDSNP